MASARCRRAVVAAIGGRTPGSEPATTASSTGTVKSSGRANPAATMAPRLGSRGDRHPSPSFVGSIDPRTRSSSHRRVRARPRHADRRLRACARGGRGAGTRARPAAAVLSSRRNDAEARAARAAAALRRSARLLGPSACASRRIADAARRPRRRQTQTRRARDADAHATGSVPRPRPALVLRPPHRSDPGDGATGSVGASSRWVPAARRDGGSAARRPCGSQGALLDGAERR